MAQRQNSVVEDEAAVLNGKLSLSNIIGPDEETDGVTLPKQKINPFDGVSWSRTTHLPTHNNFFLDDNKLDTPCFVRTSSPIEIASSPMANLKDMRRLHSTNLMGSKQMAVVEERAPSSSDETDDDADSASLEGQQEKIRPQTPVSTFKTKPSAEAEFSTTMKQEINTIRPDLRTSERESPGIRLRNKYAVVKDSFIS